MHTRILPKRKITSADEKIEEIKDIITKIDIMMLGQKRPNEGQRSGRFENYFYGNT